MKYKSLEEQNEKFISILKENKDLMKVLDYLEKLGLPNFYIAAGSIYQTIWNYYDEKPLNYGIEDVDIIYCDRENTSRESEEIIEEKIREYFKEMNIPYEFDVHNEGRMHLWKKENENQVVDYYENSEDAISQWLATVQAVGVTLENGKIKVYAPYGLSDIFSKTIRPIKTVGKTKELYDKKVAKWQKRFDGLNIIEW